MGNSNGLDEFGRIMAVREHLRGSRDSRLINGVNVAGVWVISGSMAIRNI